MQILTGARMRILAYLKDEGHANAAELVAAGIATRGSMYTTLHRMEKEGYIESWQHKDRFSPGLPLRFFKLTRKGEVMLRAMKAADRILNSEK